MKKLICTLAIFTQFAFGQGTIDKILKVEYDEYRIYTPDFINLDLGTLIVSDDYSYYNSIVQKKITNNTANPENAVMVETGKGNKEILPEIVINRKQNLLTERLFEGLYLKNYFAVQEALPKMKWKLTNEKKTIGGYNCKKASVEFRGRTYDAWYTVKIPIALGPWKFNGLPGLILEVNDLKSIYKWQVKLISYKSKIAIDSIDLKVKDDPKFEKITFKDYEGKKIKKVQEKIQTNKARNGNRGTQFDMMITFEYDKEPVNEFRNQTEFR